MTEINFTPLGHPDVLLVNDKEHSNQYLHITEPSLILIFGWMDAPMHLLQKYVQGHRELYTRARIVLIKSKLSTQWATSSEKERRLELLAKMIIKEVYYDAQTGGMLVHVISNGGGFQLMVLTSVLKRLIALQPLTESSHLPPPPIAMIIDSAPGSDEYQSMLSMFTKSIRSPILKEAIRLPASIIWLAYGFINVLRGTDFMLLQKLRAQLRSNEPFPLATRETPTVYIYSDKDEMVPFQSVESHLVDLARLGFTGVRSERYTGSQHASHAKFDRARYWDAVSKAWEDAKRMKEHRVTGTNASKHLHTYSKL